VKRGRSWLNGFIKSCIELEDQSDCEGKEWTDFMGRVLDRVGDKTNCYVVRRRPGKKEESGEYLNIDALFIKNSEYDLATVGENGWDPFVLSHVVVELENSYNINKISYCLWKILCIRAPIRVLVCYQNTRNKVRSLKEHLEKVIRRGRLMKGTDSDLLVIIGNESAAGDDWGKFYAVFEWRNDKLERVEGLSW